MIRPLLLAATLLACAIPVVFATKATAQTAPGGLPATLQGTWGYEAVSCTEENDDGRLNVEPRAVTFFASSCTFSRVQRGRDGTWTGHGRCSEEGEEGQTSGRVQLRLVSDGRLWIARDGGPATLYQRCARAMPVR